MPVMSWAEWGLEGDAIGKYASLFYADNGTFRSRDPEWLQDTNQHLCNLFRNCIGLKPNNKKENWSDDMSSRFNPGPFI